MKKNYSIIFGLLICLSLLGILRPSFQSKDIQTRVITNNKPFYAPVLTYHHIAPKLTDNPYYVSPDMFGQQMAWLRDHAYHVISYDQFYKFLHGEGALPERPVVLTFDDADEDHYTNAFRILKKYGYTGTFFVPVTFVDMKDRLTWDMLKEMVAAGMDIESHSMTHPDMGKLNAQQLQYELNDSKSILEKTLGIQVNYFAYPGGAHSKLALQEIAKAGYFSAVTVEHSVYHTHSENPFLVPRMHIDSDMVSFVGFVTGTRKN